MTCRCTCAPAEENASGYLGGYVADRRLYAGGGRFRKHHPYAYSSWGYMLSIGHFPGTSLSMRVQQLSREINKKYIYAATIANDCQ